VIAPPPLIFIAGLGIGFGLNALLPSTSVPDGVAWGVGGVLLTFGLALVTTFLGSFRRAHTPVDPRRATTAIVTAGPYRVTRNPAYLGMALIYAGIAVVSGAPWVLLALAPTLVVVDRGVIAREERYLEAKFGQEYLRYKARTRRWL